MSNVIIIIIFIVIMMMMFLLLFQGHSKVAELWKSSGLQWKDFLKAGDNVQDFVAKNVSTCNQQYTNVER